jgi:voltage-gated potassium channel
VKFLAAICDFIVRNRFVALFGSLVLFMLSLPLVDLCRPSEGLDPPRVLENLVFISILAAAIVSVARSTTGKVVALVLALPAAVLHLFHGHAAHFEVAGYLIALVFLGYTVVVILRFVFSNAVVTSDTVFAALCVFQLLAVVWALAYSVCATLDPRSFTFTVSGETPRPSLRIGQGGALPVLYFSISTLTTLGYGDIVPASSFTRMLACTEALIGQLYLTVLVARLVGLYAAAPARPARTPPDGEAVTAQQGKAVE